ncbi:MAG: hypothetical protein HPY62_11375 [Bacteroidales bacterium]|nr:hypothetical protein [Bacteroidales bacterium]
MKTLKVIVLSVIISVFGFSKSEAQDKKIEGEYLWFFDTYWSTQIEECTGERVSGNVIIYYFATFTEKHRNYHERGHGDLVGESGTSYTLDVEYNNRGTWNEPIMCNGGYSCPMQIRREGKLVAIIHESYHGVAFIDDLENPVVDRYVHKVECK